MTRAHIETERPLPRARALKLALLTAAFTAACGGSAYAEPAIRAGSSAPQPVHESPYSIDLLAPDGRTLETYEHRGRFYVLGHAGERYTVRVRNPTQRRVEAVISIDGLDAIDGETADYKTKRGYIVPARGEVRIDGFRVSEHAVAAFRFSSVADSYAGRKGRARNVGVIGVAIFEERHGGDQIVYGPYREPRHRRYRSHRGQSGRASGRAERSRSDQRAPAEAEAADGDAPAAGTRAPRGGAEARRAPRGARRDDYRPHEPPPETRPGLGTEFGERRHAPVTWTRFERDNPRRPTAIAELRYNDADGLTGLGIDLGPLAYDPYHDELWMRETASPFPFARPPGYR